ncbi:dihydrofolate reductase [Candidatus Nomurabacteria bacterium RIFCSPLOWO2_01_FULL_39_17]|uniref:Dihydrofolate reductase n=1 Tax=Candidatus Nomurabacteria bacterium RIFCSPLOWO2_01_FULL_39_17 TaxID=1801770 RepID=A0A1F6WW89_9BACT|nr:MAG: dihydrofolate reductase [Candidatus Nomurabacteria bacterium RIFCSPLOWO2_01_FULL_39_17]
MISIIAAIGKNNELGKNNSLVWNMPADMQYFRNKTKGHTVIMGRKTFESIGRPMPNRKNIIITRDENYLHHGIDAVHSLDEALKLASEKEAEIFIIGGAEIYRQSMNLADRLYITHIEAEDKDADTFFPEIIPVVWNKISREEHKKDKENPFDYIFSVYEKI